MINLKTELSIHFEALKKDGRKASHVGFTISRKKQAQEITKQPEQPEQKIKALDIYKAISNNNLLPRFLQHGESTEDLINRIKSDFKNDQSDLWINKLLEFDITF
jgi:plasmid replication initiation protein